MKLIVGLGNPGRKYAKTRHNVGFEVISEVARRCASGKARKKFQADTVEAAIDGQQVLLLLPQTYMNRSGDSVQPAMAYYRLGVEELLIVCDDFNLPLARLRFRADGSAGGQKGLVDVIRRIGSEDFARLRVGIGAPPEGRDVADYVLSPFGSEELANIGPATSRAADAVMDWTRFGTQYCMNAYNGP